MFTQTAIAATAVQNTRRGLGFQPLLLAHSIPASPRQHSRIAGYMMRLVPTLERFGAPSCLARAVSGSRTGTVAEFGALRPTKATPPSPRALRATATFGRVSKLEERTLISLPIWASSLPPGIGGSASDGRGGAAVPPIGTGSLSRVRPGLLSLSGD